MVRDQGVKNGDSMSTDCIVKPVIIFLQEKETIRTFNKIQQT